MKNSVLLTAALAALALASCQKTEGYGRLDFSLKEGDVADVTTKGSVSDYATLPSEGDFTLTIKSGTTTSWTGLMSAYDPTTQFKTGNYTAEVTYGNPEDEGYDKPYFFGTTDFSIIGGQSTPVTIPVSLGNSIVKIVTTTAFDNYYTAKSFKITTGAGTVIDNVSGPVFMDAYKFTLTGSLTTQGGGTKTIAAQTWNVEAATCYSVKFDVTNTGSTTVSISFDNTVQEVSFTEELND